MKKIYYNAMYQITDSIMWLTMGVDKREEWQRWWNISEDYRNKRDTA